MKKKLTHEIAFFNLLKNIIPAKFKYSEYLFSIEEMEEKLEMDRHIIRGLLANLESENLLKILSENKGNIKLSFESSYDMLLEVFSIDDIERLIREMQFFLKRNYKYFEINSNTCENILRKYAIASKEIIKFQGSAADLNPIIKKGIKEIFQEENNIIELKKQIYNACLNAEERDLEALEAILFCDVNFPPQENPFYVTLFLTKLTICIKKV